MKALDDPTYWHRFGRGALSKADMPTPKEAADTIIALMAARNNAINDLERVKNEARVALSCLRAPLMEAANKVDDAIADMDRRFAG